MSALANVNPTPTPAPLSPVLTSPDDSVNRLSESGANPFAIYRDDRKRYFDVLVESLTQPVIDGIAFPRFPHPAMQERIHGHSGEHSLWEAFQFFDLIKGHCGAFKEGGRLLDFGSGWGRMVRPFMPHFDLQNIVGLEPNQWFCQTARAVNPYVTFINSALAPPTLLRGGSVDYIMAWSVFSHLPEGLARAWLAEFANLARPGARMFLTTWGERFFDQLETAPESHWYAASIKKALGDVAATRARFRAGEYVFYGNSAEYGHTWISEGAMRRILPDGLEIETVDGATLPQLLYVLRKS